MTGRQIKYKVKKLLTDGTEGNFCAMAAVGDSKGGDIGPVSPACAPGGGEIVVGGEEARGGEVAEELLNTGAVVTEGDTIFFFFFKPAEYVDCWRASMNTLLSCIS